MKTSKPTSTISFNSLAYLKLKLDELIDSKFITVYHLIAHKGEGDESGSKDHIHVYLEPSRLIQTDDFMDHFKEFDASVGLPKKCLPFRPSEFSNWYLYSIHDIDYLLSRPSGPQERLYQYAYDDVISSSQDELYRAVSEIDKGKLAPVNMIKKAIDSGLSFNHLVGTGQVPIHQIKNYQHAYQLLLFSKDRDR